MSYADADEIACAVNNGYEVSVNQKSGHSFVNGQRHVWSIYSGWQTADLIDGYYRNHQPFTDLSDALRRPLTDEN